MLVEIITAEESKTGLAEVVGTLQEVLGGCDTINYSKARERASDELAYSFAKEHSMEEVPLHTQLYASWVTLGPSRQKLQDARKSEETHLVAIDHGYSLFLKNRNLVDPIFSIVGYEANMGSNYPDVVVGMALPQNDVAALQSLNCIVHNIPAGEKIDKEEIASMLTPEYINEHSKELPDHLPQVPKYRFTITYLDSETMEDMFNDVVVIQENVPMSILVDGESVDVSSSDLKLGDTLVTITSTGGDELKAYAKVIEIEPVTPELPDIQYETQVGTLHFKLSALLGDKDKTILVSGSDTVKLSESGEYVSVMEMISSSLGIKFHHPQVVGELTFQGVEPITCTDNTFTYVQVEGLVDDIKQRTTFNLRTETALDVMDMGGEVIGSAMVGDSEFEDSIEVGNIVKLPKTPAGWEKSLPVVIELTRTVPFSWVEGVPTSYKMSDSVTKTNTLRPEMVVVRVNEAEMIMEVTQFRHLKPEDIITIGGQEGSPRTTILIKTIG